MELHTKVESQPSVVNLVIEKIKRAIILGELKPGDKIPTENELVEQLGVGRYSIREAIKMLVALGVLEIRRAKGTFVIDRVTPQLIDPMLYRLLLANHSSAEFKELRLFFERTILELAARKATEDDIGRLEQNMRDFERKVTVDSSYEEIIASDKEFHRSIAAASRNVLLESLYESFFQVYVPALEQIEKSHYISMVMDHHKLMLQLIKDRTEDVVVIRQVLENSLAAWKEQVR